VSDGERGGTSEDAEAEHLAVVVPSLMDGMRVDRALSMLTGCSRAEATRLIGDAMVSVDATVVAKASSTLAEGALLEAVLPVLHEHVVAPEAEVVIDVVEASADFVVVNKRFDQVVHPGAGNATGTLIAGVLARFPEVAELPALGFGEATRPGVVHRLDKGTSGLLVIARTPLGFSSLSEQIAARSMSRRYLGVVEGHLEHDRGVIDAPLGRSPSTPTRMTVRADGRDARTDYEVQARHDDPARSLVALALHTGRTHQIRVHLAAIHHPIVNDPRYGQRNERALEADRLALHAGRLAFADPATGAPISFVAPWPEDLGSLGFDEPAARWLGAA
jgi:23S rRNA pseudouridine1911/1915/1917 synthase